MIFRYINKNVELHAYHILSYATLTANTRVLKRFAKYFDHTYRPDGNAYDLVNLAIENYITDDDSDDSNESIESNDGIDSNEGIAAEDNGEIGYESDGIEDSAEAEKSEKAREFDTIFILIETHIKNFGSIDIGYATRQLVGYCKKTDDYTLVDILIRKYSVCLWNMYHYAIAWGAKKVFDTLVSDYDSFIDY